MTMLSEVARVILAEATLVAAKPRPNARAMVKLIMMVADDVAQYNQTGRTHEMTEADANVVMAHILDGGLL